MSAAILDRVRRGAGRLDRPRTMSARREAGILSLCFDDFPKSAWEEGGRILSDHGARATYFACGALCGERFDGQDMFDVGDIEALLADGHELGCHTFDHVSALRRTGRGLAQSFTENARFVRERFGDVRMVSFAYPYGDATVAAKRAATPVFACARGVDAGLNGAYMDLAQLKAVGLEAHRGGADFVGPYIEAAARERAWLIVYSHDVAASPSRFGCTAGDLARIIGRAQDAGLEILTVKGGLAARAFGRA